MATTSYERIFVARILDGMLPFTETPSNKYQNATGVERDRIEKRIDAVELFSFFTADVIRKEVIFTR